MCKLSMKCIRRASLYEKSRFDSSRRIYFSCPFADYRRGVAEREIRALQQAIVIVLVSFIVYGNRQGDILSLYSDRRFRFRLLKYLSIAGGFTESLRRALNDKGLAANARNIDDGETTGSANGIKEKTKALKKTIASAERGNDNLRKFLYIAVPMYEYRAAFFVWKKSV